MSISLSDFIAPEEQTRIKLLKKEEILAKKESQKIARAAAVFGGGGAPAPAPEPSRTVAPHLLGANPGAAPGTPLGAVGPTAIAGAVGSVSYTPGQMGEPKCQLVEVEEGIYDIYFTCPCGQQYVIRCESIEKAAEAPLP